MVLKWTRLCVKKQSRDFKASPAYPVIRASEANIVSKQLELFTQPLLSTIPPLPYEEESGRPGIMMSCGSRGYPPHCQSTSAPLLHSVYGDLQVSVFFLLSTVWPLHPFHIVTTIPKF